MVETVERIDPVGETARTLGLERFPRPPKRRFFAASPAAGAIRTTSLSSKAGVVVVGRSVGCFAGVLGADMLVDGAGGPFIKLWSLRFVE